MAELIKTGTRSVSDPYRWRDRQGNFFLPSEMETRHLFFTLRMIWNNHFPSHMHVGEVTLYRFPRRYTRQYFEATVYYLGRELVTRRDMAPEWEAQWKQMQSWFPDWEEVEQGRIGSPQPKLEDKR